MLCALKKTLGVCLIGLGLGILLVLLLPISGWLFAIGIAVVIVGLAWLSCKWGIFKNILRKRRVKNMTIVVKKVPKCLRGIVKLLFGIKEK